MMVLPNTEVIFRDLWDAHDVFLQESKTMLIVGGQFQHCFYESIWCSINGCAARVQRWTISVNPTLLAISIELHSDVESNWSTQ